MLKGQSKKVSTPRGTDVISPLAWPSFFFRRLWETVHALHRSIVTKYLDGNPSYDGFTIMIKVILVIESNG